MNLVVRILMLLGINGIPFVGWFLGDWSQGTVMVLYWSESFLLAGLVALRCHVHWAATRKYGHLRSTSTKSPAPAGSRTPPGNPESRWSTLGNNYLITSWGFLLGQGVMLGVVLVLMTGREGLEDTAFSLNDYSRGMAGVGILLTLGFLIDFVMIKTRPMAWMQGMVQNSLGRVFVFQFTILAGLPLMAVTDQPQFFFSVFVALKTLMDFGIYLPKVDPAEPPRWLCAIMDRIPSAHGSPETGGFAAYWRADRAEQIELAELDEQPVRSP